MTDPVTPSQSSLDEEKEDFWNDIDSLLNRHLEWIQSHVHRKLGSLLRTKADTGDIVQDAVVQFLKYGPRIRLSNDKQFRALICRIIENVICDKYDWFTARRRSIAKERPLAPDTVLNLDPVDSSQKTPSRIVQKQEEEAWARLGLELIEPQKREVIVLHHWENQSFMEIGDHYEISKVAARKRYMAAMDILIDTVEALKGGRFEDVLGPDLTGEMES